MPKKYVIIKKVGENMINIELKELLKTSTLSNENLAYFSGAIITDPILKRKHYHDGRREDTVLLNVELPLAVPFNALKELKEFFSNHFNCAIRISFKTKDCLLDSLEIKRYVQEFDAIKGTSLFTRCNVVVKEDQVECISADETVVEMGNQILDELHAFMTDLGVNYHFFFSMHKVEYTFEEVKIETKPAVAPKKEVVKNNYRTTRLKLDKYPEFRIKDCLEEVNQIKITGTIFDIESKARRDGKLIVTMMIYDDEDAISVKCFEGRYFTAEDLGQYKKGDCCSFYGGLKIDSFSFNKELAFMAEAIEKLPVEKKPLDDADEKRCELHVHSNMSEMDGVCEVDELITHAFNSGHKAIAITDHSVVQAYPKAQGCVSGLLKKNPDRDFKVIYGVEVNLVDERLKIVYNSKDLDLDKARYCVFDIETTGLSTRYDSMIEFGGVIFENGEIKERLQFFVKPAEPIPAYITQLTHITNDMVCNEPDFAHIADKLLNFMDGCVLVAHNASFDYGFINQELERIGRAPLNNPVIDTLDLARAIHSDRRTYRLGNIARLYRVVYDDEVAHRADYDAEVLASVFALMLNDCKKKEARNLNQLNDLQDDRSYIKVRKSHATVLATNKVGLKHLFELITVSHTDTLAIFGKANSKNNGEEFMAEPRVLRRTLNEKREGLLIGTACYNGEIFETAANRSLKELEEKLAFYDYVEIQPLENYRPLIEAHSIGTWDRLKTVLKSIIDTAKKMGKIVVATGDVHYTLPSEKILRDIYISAQGIGGVRHPLFVYNAERRRRTIHPDQHFRNTKEMLEAFSWLDENLAKELVITNPNKIADMCESLKPLHSGLFAPVIEGSDQKLRDICYQTAHNLYGEQLPEIVEKRLERELTSIIGNGYAIIYYISHLLVKKSNDDGYMVGSRGSVGSSFVATMSGITEVNPLAPHYICPHCHYSEFITDGSVASGFDLPDKVCPKCNSMMRGDGQDIPFETFLGFEGDKVPDIDLNFSGEYQRIAHAYIKEVFGESNCFRAGTIGTVAQKTAYGYVSGFCEENGIENMRYAQKTRLAMGCEGVKRTTGQHPAGIIVIPDYMEVHDFTPVNYPANNPESEWKTTHFDFHAIHDNVLKFDILGHVDPTAMRLLQNISGIDPRSIPMNDPETMSLFSSSEALKANPKIYDHKTGACGLPEFGTPFVRGILELTKPKAFSDLVIISGLSHGTDVWLNNAKDIIEEGTATLQNVIGCRDDIMTYLIHNHLPPKDSFFIMESVRKGKGLKDEWIALMKEHHIPQWYIDSCLKIKYMFPKAHAVAYVMMAVRIAWFKVHYPHYYYVSYFTLRCDAYEIETMIQGPEVVQARINDINERYNNIETKKTVTTKELQLLTTLESVLEMQARGYRIGNLDINLSLATEFRVLPEDPHTIIPPFTVVDGLGASVARSVVEARKKGSFLSKQDIMNRTQLSATLLKKLSILGVLDGLQEENQMSLF